MQIRRSKLEIVLSILTAVRDGVDKPTRIMYAANLSWKPTQRILGSLVEQGLLMETGETGSKRSKVKYGITEKGANVLRYFDRAKDLVDIEVLT
jgi:predicted transcriptional regulator